MSNKKKNKKRHPGPTQASVKLSQCMIVKNEEKNIERALSWAKGIAFEQIVVDTGSTDRTVEIAEKMGAKVYRFEWIDDFSAAKNFAIEKASGNWIAMLDADEYFSKEDAKTLYSYLRKIKADPDLRDNCLVLNTPLVNLDDNGRPVSVYDQERVFRNIPSARYKGKIHEIIDLPPESVFRTDDITVMHTGYASAAFKETEKAARNIALLREEIKERPDDLKLKSFLADALIVEGDEQSLAEAEKLYYDVVSLPGAYAIQKAGAYKYLIEKYINSGNRLPEAESLSLKAVSEFPQDIDLEYFLGAVLNRKGDFKSAMKRLKECETKLLGSKSLDSATILPAKPGLLFFELTAAAQGMGDLTELVKYATMTLSIDKTQTRVLASYLSELIKINTPEEEVMELLSKVYDPGDTGDLLLIARAAKECGALEFAKGILALQAKRDA